MDNQEQILKKQVLKEITTLRSIANDQEAKEAIDGIWVFSGPGTFLVSLLNGENPRRKWMDRQRIICGIALVRIITAKRLKKKVVEVTKEDIKKSGPILIYNGIPIENDDFRKVMQSSNFILPFEKVVIVDGVTESPTISHPIKNTADQIKGFPKYLIGNNGPIKKHLALISHAEHLPRILRYLAKYQSVPEHIKIVLYPLKSSEEVYQEYKEEEAEKVWKYYKEGFLSWNPRSSFEE